MMMMMMMMMKRKTGQFSKASNPTKQQETMYV